MGVEDMKTIAHLIALTLKDFEGNKMTVQKGVADLVAKYKLYE